MTRVVALAGVGTTGTPPVARQIFDGSALAGRIDPFRGEWKATTRRGATIGYFSAEERAVAAVIRLHRAARLGQ